MSHKFFDFETLEQGSSSMVNLIKQLYYDGGNQQRLISPSVKPGFLRQVLPETAPEEGSSVSELINDTKNYIYPGLMLWQSPRFFGFYPSTIAVTNVFAEMFTSTFQTPAFNYFVAPAYTQLENIVGDWVVQSFGLPKKFLIKNSGGSILSNTISESAFVSVHVAKYLKMKKLDICQKNNNLEKIVKFVGYYGDFSFICNNKNLKMKQIFYRRSVPTYYCEKIKNLTIDSQKFEKMVQEDVNNGLIPFWYGGTYGTTFSGATDINHEVIRICKKYDMWINLDAAYLGSGWCCQELRPNIKLLQEIDSIEINFTKALFLSGGSISFISDKKKIKQAMTPDQIYSFYKNEYSDIGSVVDYKDWTLGLGRRNNSLKYYFLFKHYGMKNIRNFIRHTVNKANKLAERIQESKIFKLFCKPELGLVCFQLCDKNGEPSNKLTYELVKRIKNIKQGFMSAGYYKQYVILRIVIGNQNSSDQFVNKYFSAIEKQGEIIIGESERKQI